MAILSKELKAKLLGSDWSFGYNCYEVGHTWTPSCTGAALEVSLAGAMRVVPLYSMLYSFSQLAVQHKYDLISSLDTAKSILRSSLFIFFSAYNGAIMGCALRASFGRFYYRVLVCMPALISSYLSIVIEKPSRRQALAFYLLNMASEIVYRMMVTKGYVRPLIHGETLLFALSLAAWYHLIKSEGFGHDPVSGIMKALIGRDEAKSRARRFPISERDNNNNSLLAINHNHNDTDTNYQNNEVDTMQTSGSYKLFKHQGHVLEDSMKLGKTQTLRTAFSKHESCHHQESSCLDYVLSTLPSRFLIGYTIQAVLSVSKNPIALIQEPGGIIKQSLLSSNPIKFGLFLATLVGGGRGTSCFLRHYSDGEHEWHAPLAGLVAGLSMLWAPRASISMYVMWKAIEQHYLLAARKGRVKHVEFTVRCIYSVSAATILYTFALEPQFIRPSYMKFLDNASEHRLHQLNRMVLDVFGTGSSVGYEDFFPDLDPRLMSNQFKELVFNWMIQPYE